MERSPPLARRPAREIRIDERHAGQRIDNFLSATLDGVPRARIYRILRRGEVRVNRGRIRQHYRLEVGDVVRIPPVRVVARPLGAPPARPLRERVESAVLFEDPGLIVLDKPAGMAVHGGSGHVHGVIEALRAAREAARYLELAHRLDRDTSGCLVVAKRRRVLTALHADLRRGAVDKRYLALVRGHWEGRHRIDTSLRKNVLRSGERVVRLDPDGKPSSTEFRALSHGADTTLVEVRPSTGRTHQIRVHAAASGHPIGGDVKYGDRVFDRRLRAFGLDRLFLHAWRIAFVNPLDERRLVVCAALPAELSAVCERAGLDVPEPMRHPRPVATPAPRVPEPA